MSLGMLFCVPVLYWARTVQAQRELIIKDSESGEMLIRKGTLQFTGLKDRQWGLLI